MFDVESLCCYYVCMFEYWVEWFEINGEIICVMVGEKKYCIWCVYLVGCVYVFDVDEIFIF